MPWSQPGLSPRDNRGGQHSGVCNLRAITGLYYAPSSRSPEIIAARLLRDTCAVKRY